MKLRNAAILILFSLAVGALAVFAAGCSSGFDGYDIESWEGAVVTFMLEGGIYKNSAREVEHYYSLDEGEDILIQAPSVYDDKYSVRRPNYKLIEWCRTRTPDGEGYTYSDPWDFEKDTVAYGDRVTLYANWEALIKHYYDVCYLDDEGVPHLLEGDDIPEEERKPSNSSIYEVGEGQIFNDYRRYASKRSGYTALPGYYYLATDEETGEQVELPLDSTFHHPGGEEEVHIKVIVKYIEGTFKLVSTVSDLNSVASRDNVYLMNDIDFNGATLVGLRDYSAIFRGNGYTVSNFNLNRGTVRGGGYGKDDLITDNDLGGSNILCISIFGNVEGAEISDVHFKGVTIDVDTGYSQLGKVYIAPIAVKVASSAATAITAARATSITNVTFEGTYTITQLPAGFDTEEDLIVTTDAPYYYKAESDASKVENCTVSLTDAAVPEAVKVDLYFKKYEY